MADMFDIDDANMLRWGRFIKTLATGIDHLNGPPANPVGAGPVTGPLVDAAKNPKLAAIVAYVQSRRTGPGRPLIPRAEFDAALTEQGIIVANYPARFTQVELSQTSDTVLAIRLPALDVIVEREAQILRGAAYSVPVYVQNWIMDRIQDNSIDAQRRLDFNSERVAGYSIAHCEE